MAEREEERKNLLMKGKEESEKVWLKAQHSENEDHGIWSHHFTGSRRENSENRVRFSFGGGSQITADGDCSHEIKTVAPWKKSYNLPRQHVKSKDITLLTKTSVWFFQ